MKRLFTKYWHKGLAEEAGWFLIFFTLPLSLRFNGLSIIITAGAVLISYLRNPHCPNWRKAAYLSIPVLYFLWQARELLWYRPLVPAWKETEQQLSLVVFPVIFLLSTISRQRFTRSSARGLVLSLLLCGIVMISAAGLRFIQSGDWHEFLYHQLAAPFHPGAIYFSLFLILALYLLKEENPFPNSARFRLATGLFFLFLLLLFSGKMLITIGFPLLAWHYRENITAFTRRNLLLASMLVLIIFAASVPFIFRVKQVAVPGLEMVKNQTIPAGQELNGLNMRLIFWRFGIEILQEQEAWISGTGMVRSQLLLNDRIRETGLYTGTGIGNDTGYLNYNFHDQYVETLVRTGIPGLFLLLLIVITFARQPGSVLFAPKMFMWIILFLFLTESVLERQAGIVLFCIVFCAFFPASHKYPENEQRDCK